MPSTSPGREPAVKQFTDAHDCVSAQPQQPPTGHEHQSMEDPLGHDGDQRLAAECSIDHWYAKNQAIGRNEYAEE